MAHRCAPARAAKAGGGEVGPYTLDAGDKLRIVVFGQDTLSNTYIVDAEGRVSLPLIGTVNARGMTTAQLSGAIKSRLSQGFIRDPSVAVEVEVYRPFFVLGEVTYPGQYPYVPNMTVENAIAIAGGFTPRAAKDRVSVTRKCAGSPTRTHSAAISAAPRRHHHGQRALVLSETVTRDPRRAAIPSLSRTWPAPKTACSHPPRT